MSTEQNKLLEPVKIGSLTLRNRIVLAPMGTYYIAADGSVTKRLIDYHTRFAKGGIGLIIPEGTCVDELESSVMSPCLATSHNRYMPGLNELAESVKEQGAAIFGQISHAGHQTKIENIKGLIPVAPSAIASQFFGVVPKELNKDKITEIQESFVEAALRLQTARYDGTEIHGANGYLLTQFLSPRTNKRKDKYGGSIENRARMSLEIIEKVRAKTKPDFVVGYRLCAHERLPGGITPEDVVAFAKMLEKAGVDYIHVTTGVSDSMLYAFPPMYVSRGLNTPLAQMVKEAVNVPVMCAGTFTTESGSQAVKEGKTDLVVIGRGHLADPELSAKLMNGREEDIRPCIRCNGCMGRSIDYRPLDCDVNPSLGRSDRIVTKTDTPKKVVVVGGGISGMEAARLAAEQGHRVTLLEQNAELGGYILPAMVPEFKQDIRTLLTWLKTQIKKEKVDVRLNCNATPELVKGEKPDVLILAVGSDYVVPPGIQSSKNLLFPPDVFLGKKEIGEQVVIVGGGQEGCETALYIAENLKKKVTIIEKRGAALLDCGDPMSMMAIRMRLQFANVKIINGLNFTGFSGNTIDCIDNAGKNHQMDADTVILALGVQPRKDTVDKLSGICGQTYKVGSCIEHEKIFYHAYYAFRSAWQTVLAI
ncbi:MAG: FAD-dependent oxidoreductase [Smithella sp.]|nr:FAD-dependent oxidoreductase [Smithella sp.]